MLPAYWNRESFSDSQNNTNPLHKVSIKDTKEEWV